MLTLFTSSAHPFGFCFAVTNMNCYYFPGSGDHDMCVPYTGSQAWTRSMGYKIVDEWRPWTSNGQVAGYHEYFFFQR